MVSYKGLNTKQKPTKIIKVPNPINVKEINVKSKKNVSLICLIII